MTLQKWEFIDLETAIWLNLTYPDPDEQISKIRINGLNGYPNVDGSYFKMDKNWFGFATSQSCLLNLYSKSIYEVMLVWWSGYYDDKGVGDHLVDWLLTTFV